MIKKNKIFQMRVDNDFLEKVNYLKEINGYSTPTQTIRKTIEKEYRKEKMDDNGKPWYDINEVEHEENSRYERIRS